MNSNLKSFFKDNKINYILHKHPAVFTVEESSKIIKGIPGLRTKSLFLKDEDSRFYLITLPGQKRLNIKFLKFYFKIKELNFASPEELKNKLNTTPGSVSPLAILNSQSVQFILDQEVWNADIVQCHPDINTETLEIASQDFKKFYNILPGKKSVIEIPAEEQNG